MEVVVRVGVFLFGMILAFSTLGSAVKTFVLPRSSPDILSTVSFRLMRRIFTIPMYWARSYYERDRILALFAPISLIMLVPIWLILVNLGYACMFWALGLPWREAYIVSGSSLLTLGFATVNDLPKTILAFSEATIGLILAAGACKADLRPAGAMVVGSD